MVMMMMVMMMMVMMMMVMMMMVRNEWCCSEVNGRHGKA